MNHVLSTFEQRLLEQIENQAGESAVLEAKIAGLEKKICNCTSAIAEGHAFKSLLDQISLLEAEMRQAESRLASLRSKSSKV